MFKALLILAGVITVAFSSCLPTNNTIDTTDVEKSLPSLQYGCTNFALEMFRALHEDSSSDNLFFSPISVWTALVTIYEGARHETAKELALVLGIINTSLTTLPAALDVFLKSCSGCQEENEQSNLKIANRIYFQEDLEFELCNQYLEKIIRKIDFKSDPKKATTIINNFIEKETNGKITNLVTPNSIGPLTQMIIANAVYFKGTWKNQFIPSMTRPARFHISRDSTLTVSMMNTIGTYFYAVSDQMDCQALEIPYDGEQINMLILLPKHSFRGLDILAKTITPERLQALLNSMASREVLVSIPKFKIEQEYELSVPLQKMGLRNIFDARFADLTGFTESKGLSLDAIRHKSYIKVNEEGTEAAAATAFVLSRTGTHDSSVTRFFADRPFLYFIRDTYSNSLLFMGTIKSPQYTESP